MRRRYLASGEVLAELRYVYDNADRIIARQWVHQGGQTDFFRYDTAGRLVVADLGARPQLGEGDSPWNVTQGSVAGNWEAGDYARTYQFIPGQHQWATVTTSIAGAQIPDFGAEYDNWNTIGHAGEVDGIPRTRDVLGNVTQLQTTWGLTQLRYDSLSRLRRVERPDGAVLTYEYRAEGPLARRRLTCGSAPSCVESDRIYIYDGLLLLEEYKRQGSGPPRLWARYYYAEEGDIPLGGDFWDPQTHTYARRYFIVDRQGSVVGQIDGQGNWVERVRYDVYGRVQYRSADAIAPRSPRFWAPPTAA